MRINRKIPPDNHDFPAPNEYDTQEAYDFATVNER